MKKLSPSYLSVDLTNLFMHGCWGVGKQNTYTYTNLDTINCREEIVAVIFVGRRHKLVLSWLRRRKKYIYGGVKTYIYMYIHTSTFTPSTVVEKLSLPYSFFRHLPLLWWGKKKSIYAYIHAPWHHQLSWRNCRRRICRSTSRTCPLKVVEGYKNIYVYIYIHAPWHHQMSWRNCLCRIYTRHLHLFWRGKKILFTHTYTHPDTINCREEIVAVVFVCRLHELVDQFHHLIFTQILLQITH